MKCEKCFQKLSEKEIKRVDLRGGEPICEKCKEWKRIIRPERNYRLAIPHPVLYGSYERENFVKIIMESEKVDSTIKEEMKEGHWI